MTDRREEILRHLREPVAPRKAFASSLLDRLEEELAGSPALSADELEAETAEELPWREAMSVITPDPTVCPDPGVVLPVEPLPVETVPVDPLPPATDQTT